MSALFDFVLLQEDMASALMNRNELTSVNVVQWQRLRIMSEIAKAKALTASRNGRSGAAILVDEPTIKVKRPNLPGPEFEVTLPVIVMVIPSMNDVPATGSLMDATLIGQWVIDTLHTLRPFGNVGFVLAVSENAMVPTTSFGNGMVQVGEGARAWRTEFNLRVTRSQTQRCDMPSVSVDSTGIATLTNGPNTPDAIIFYTLDGTFPGQFPRPGSASVRYSRPFQVFAGEELRWIAYKQGFCFSNIGHYASPVIPLFTSSFNAPPTIVATDILITP